jgi:hypothetical protein
VKLETEFPSFFGGRCFAKNKLTKTAYLLLLAFFPAAALPAEPELFDFEAELFAFDEPVFALASFPAPATFAPASTAPLIAPVAAPTAAPVTISAKASVAFSTMPLDEPLLDFF